jgi:hypothetical protein
MNRNFVLIRTDLFVSEQPDEEIGVWLLGADCAGWLYARLLLVEGIEADLDPTMEDWGWIFGVAVDGVAVSICVWDFLNSDGTWLLGPYAKQRWLRRWKPARLLHAEKAVCDALDQIFENEPRIAKRKWFADNPFDLKEVDF